MLNQEQRAVIRRYFYGTKGPIVLAALGAIPSLWIGAMIADVKGAFIFLCICLGIAALWALKERFFPDTEGENEYDQQLMMDLTEFSQRALEKLCLVSEQVSLIDPIKVHGPYYGYTEYRKTKQRGPLMSALILLLKILFIEIYLPYLGIKLLVKGFQYTPKLLFRYGSDGVTRYSMVEFNIFIFSENQIYVYTACYDICSGEIYEERTAEYFYQDVDCVITGSKVEKVLSRKKLINKYFEYFKLIVTSGTSTSAIADGASILNTQVKGMRELVRNKKEEITL